MAESAALFVLETIGNLLIDEAKFLWGVEGKVKDLQKELEQIQRLLGKMDKRRQHDQTVGEWITELREVAYDAEDIIEQYILRITPKKDVNIVKAYAYFMSKCSCLRVHAVGTRIENLKSRISNLRMRMEPCGIRSMETLMPIRTYAHYEENFVGRKDSIKELVEELLKDAKQDKVISIWGMDGLGKTALAKKVFSHDDVRKHFDSFAWACVSREYQVKDILEEICIQLIPDKREEVTKMRREELLKVIYYTQKQKKCIVVLDDISTTEAWDSLQPAFPINDTGSKLLITTHHKIIAEHIGSQGFFHQPRRLSDEESWELLKMKASPQMEEITENKKNLVGEQLQKCGGLPLAIIGLAGLLVKNDETFDGNINSNLSDKISEVLALSYNDLPWHLKQCFLYLCSFPTDEEIPLVKVLLMWIAEGFVLPNAYVKKKEVTAEDAADQYLMEFVNRGLVELGFTLSGKIKTCCLRDPMRDICISKATQESFLSIHNDQQDDEVELTCANRRLSLHMRKSAEGNTIPNFNKVESNNLKLRTLMFFHSGRSVRRTWEEFQPIFIKCKLLRVLRLENLSWMRGYLPESIGDLVHLRYLSLAGSVIEGLPPSVGNLVWMEFLDLHLHLDESILVKVPNVLSKMKRLRHLHLPIRFVVNGSKKLQLDSLKHLQTLKNFCPKECDVNDIGKQTNLRKLTICKQSGSDKFKIIPQLVKFTLKNHLRSSSFRFSSPSFTEDELSKMSSYPHSCKLSIGGKIEKLPEQNNLPQQLKKLVLFFSKLEEDPMPTLEKLDHLVVLMLGPSTFVGNIMVCSAGGFPQLRHLFLDGLNYLEEWKIAKGAMPHVSRLAISKCFHLKTVPQAFYIYDGSEKIDHELSKSDLGRYFS